MYTFDFKFDFLDPNRMVLGIHYARAYMVNQEDESETKDNDDNSAHILTFGFFFFSINILIIKT